MSGASSNCWAIKWLRPLGWHQNDAGVHAFDRYPTRLRRNDRADALARWLDERPPVSGVLPKIFILSFYLYYRRMLAMPNNVMTLPQFQVETEELLRLRAKLLPPYRVVLYDDDYNEMNYVVFVLLHSINNLTQTEAERIMLTAHLSGSAIAAVCPKELAEFYQERLLSYGLTATIEPE